MAAYMLFVILLLMGTTLVAGYTSNDVYADYNDNLARLIFYSRKRSCIRRNASCDHRPNDCCYSSSCRCNLWGTNCRCQRVGLFQKWGK